MLDPARLVFIDETAVSTNMVRLRGRAPRGVRVIVPSQRPSTTIGSGLLAYGSTRARTQRKRAGRGRIPTESGSAPSAARRAALFSASVARACA